MLYYDHTVFILSPYAWHISHHPLVLTTEESVTASPLLPLVLVEKLVEISPVLLLCTVQVVPPVTDKVLLVEDCSISAENLLDCPLGWQR